MPRQDVPYGGAICRLKERIAEIWDTLNQKLHSINGVEGDGAGDVKIVSGDAAVVINNDQIGHRIEVSLNHNAIPTASSLIAGDNIEINPAEEGKIEISVTDDVSVNNLNVNGNIIQQGAAYETHAEKIYTKDDFISMRDGAIGSLAVGSLSGLEVIKYDGINNTRLAIDNKGVARIGDVGDEQPLLTRDEDADLTNGNLLEWNANDYKAVDSGKKVSDFVNGSGDIGSDTKPIKIVNGVATVVTYDLAKKSELPRIINGVTNAIITQPASIATINVPLTGFTSNPAISICPNGLPEGIDGMVWAITDVTVSSFQIALFNVGANATTMTFYYTAIGA